MAISKVEVIEDHLVAAIQMIAMDASPISTHLIVKASEEMIASVANARGILLDSDYRIYVKDEYHEEFRRISVKAYNFFKHADRDTDDQYDVIPLSDLSSLNELVTMMNGANYYKITRKNIPLLTEYAVIQSVLHPEMFKLEFLDKVPGLKQQHEMLRSTAPKMWKAALLWSLHNKGLMPAVPPKHF